MKLRTFSNLKSSLDRFIAVNATIEKNSYDEFKIQFG